MLEIFMVTEKNILISVSVHFSGGPIFKSTPVVQFQGLKFLLILTLINTVFSRGLQSCISGLKEL